MELLKAFCKRAAEKGDRGVRGVWGRQVIFQDGRNSSKCLVWQECAKWRERETKWWWRKGQLIVGCLASPTWAWNRFMIRSTTMHLVSWNIYFRARGLNITTYGLSRDPEKVLTYVLCSCDHSGAVSTVRAWGWGSPSRGLVDQGRVPCGVLCQPRLPICRCFLGRPVHVLSKFLSFHSLGGAVKQSITSDSNTCVLSS